MIAITMPALPGNKPNIVASVLAKTGDAVAEGQELFNVETSKRAVPIKAPAEGVVSRVLVCEGDEVAAGDVLAHLEEAESVAQMPAPSYETASEEHRKESDDDHVELLIIGGGTGGYVAALYASKMGKHVTLVEQDKLGGTCLNRGCIPTKTLISSADLYSRVLRADEWGIDVSGYVRPNMEAIIDRKNSVVDELVGGIEYLMDENRIRVINGTARFEGNGEVSVECGCDVLKLTFDDCIVATGSCIRPVSLPGTDLPKVHTTDEALDCKELPESVVIVGGGVTGMEFAFLYANLGVDVTVLARRPRILHMFDQEASAEITRAAENRGIRIIPNADVKCFSMMQDGSVRTVYEVDGELHFVDNGYVLLAGGRVPNTDDMRIQNTDVEMDASTGAILVDGRMRTNVAHVYAIGDVNGLAMLAHAASYQGRIAVDDILGKADPFRPEIIPSVAYTDPEVAAVGLSADEARKDPSRYRVGTFSFAHNGKALAENSGQGYVALVSDADDVLKGATIVGGHASALIGYIGLAISAGLSGEQVREAVFAHPTTSEAIHEAACDLTFGALHE